MLSVGGVRIAMLAGREVLVTNGEAKDARIQQLESEVAMLREELRINGARMKRVPSHRRPQYTAIERRRSWSFVQYVVGTKRKRLAICLSPMTRFDHGYAVQQIKRFCPTPGKVKIADMLARAGIHIGKTTVGQILKEKPTQAPDPVNDDHSRQCRIVSKYPGHTWNADLRASTPHDLEEAMTQHPADRLHHT